MTNQPFFLGVNYPWANYAEDFGVCPSGHRGMSFPENLSKIAEEFARIRDCGAGVVRWFLFADGRGGFLAEKGISLRPDEFLFADVRAALELAKHHGLKLCFSLMDYLWLQDRTGKTPEHANEQVLQFAAGREAFLHRVLIPMFREFREHPALFAWEIANEPEWAIREFHRQPAARMHYADFRAFAEEIAQAVHEFAGVPVTLGSASLAWVRAWSELGLDFLPALKELLPFVPVIVVSGALEVHEQIRALQGPRRAHYCITKPVDIHELLRTVETALKECGEREIVRQFEALERSKRAGHRPLQRVLDEDQGKEELVPRPDGHQDAQRCDCWPRQGNMNPPEEIPR